MYTMYTGGGGGAVSRRSDVHTVTEVNDVTRMTGNAMLLGSPLAAVGVGGGSSPLRSALKSAGGEVSPIKGGGGGWERRGTAASRPETECSGVSEGRLEGGMLRVRILNLYNNGIGTRSQ